jgi:hypothetical protein
MNDEMSYSNNITNIYENEDEIVIVQDIIITNINATIRNIPTDKSIIITDTLIIPKSRL